MTVTAQNNMNAYTVLTHMLYRRKHNKIVIAWIVCVV